MAKDEEEFGSVCLIDSIVEKQFSFQFPSISSDSSPVGYGIFTYGLLLLSPYLTR